jgi:phage terminase Nu1 subunit (DNA packaging protein)
MRIKNKTELAAELKVTNRTIENYMAKGMPYIRLSARASRFDMDAVDPWLNDLTTRRFGKLAPITTKTQTATPAQEAV